MGRLIERYSTLKNQDKMGIDVKKYWALVLIVLLLLQVSIPVIASTPASITIDEHPNSISTDQVLDLNAVVKDASGAELNTVINWSSSSGHIDSEGIFTPGKAGIATITAEGGGINTTTTIDVTSGYPFAISSFFNHTNISIDDTIELNASLVDRAGNLIQKQIF